MAWNCPENGLVWWDDGGGGDAAQVISRVRPGPGPGPCRQAIVLSSASLHFVPAWKLSNMRYFVSGIGAQHPHLYDN